MFNDNLILIISSISVLLFNVALLPDMYKIIKLKLFVGGTIWNPIIFLVALSTGFVTNLHYGNYIFCINDIISMILQGTMLYLRIKYGKKG